MRNFINKKLATLLLTGTIGLTSIAGCTAKNTSESSSELTTVPTTIETTFEPTETTIVVTDDMATEDYMIHAKAVAKAMYENNKEYFDDKLYTVEDLENVYYVMNGKYYDNEKNLIMDNTQLERSFVIIKELVEPQRVTELLQKFSNLEKGEITEKEYFDEVAVSKFYDYSKGSLKNFIEDNENNKELRDFLGDYSVIKYRETENLKNGVSPLENLNDFFGHIRDAQAGNISYDKDNNIIDYRSIDNYLQTTTTKPGYSFTVAAIYRAVANDINVIVDGPYVDVPTREGSERVRVGYTREENDLINLFYDERYNHTLTDEQAKKAQDLEYDLFQTMPFNVMCDTQLLITENFSYEPVKAKTKSLVK